MESTASTSTSMERSTAWCVSSWVLSLLVCCYVLLIVASPGAEPRWCYPCCVLRASPPTRHTRPPRRILEAPRAAQNLECRARSRPLPRACLLPRLRASSINETLRIGRNPQFVTSLWSIYAETMQKLAGPSRFQYEMQLELLPPPSTSIVPWHHAVLAAGPCLAASNACYNERPAEWAAGVLG